MATLLLYIYISLERREQVVENVMCHKTEINREDS